MNISILTLPEGSAIMSERKIWKQEVLYVSCRTIKSSKSCLKYARFANGVRSPESCRNNSASLPATASSAANAITTTSAAASTRTNGRRRRRTDSSNCMPPMAIDGHSSPNTSKAGTHPSIQNLELCQEYALLQITQGHPATQQICVSISQKGN